MRFSSFLSLSAVALLAASVQAATFVLTGPGSSWCDPDSWTITSGTDADGIPDLDDAVIIPNGAHADVDCAAFADTLTLQGTGSVTIWGFTLEVDGGGGGSSIAGNDNLELVDVNATLKISGTQTWSGAGSIKLDDAGALIELGSGVTFTTQLMIHGFGSIAPVAGASVTPTFSNQHSVVADITSGTLEMATGMLLDDQDGSPDSLWKATGTSAKLQFKRDAILDGDVLVESGAVLDFQATIRFTGGTDATFIFNGGSVTVGSGKVFHYDNFAGSCDNPDASGPPYALDSSGSPYGCS